MLKKENAEYNVSFFCQYETNLIRHYQTIKLTEIPKWICAYQFTHPDVKSISVKVWLDEK